jgi:hypothetical protein
MGRSFLGAFGCVLVQGHDHLALPLAWPALIQEVIRFDLRE